jgi:hypothetical protein
MIETKLEQILSAQHSEGNYLAETLISTLSHQNDEKIYFSCLSHSTTLLLYSSKLVYLKHVLTGGPL